MWSTEENKWFEYGPFDYDGQSVYLGGSFTSMLPNADIIDSWSNANSADNSWGTIKTTVSGHATISLDGATPFTESATMTTWRNDPDYSVDFSSTHSPINAAWGSTLIDLDGALLLDGNTLTRHNIDAYVDTLRDTLMSLARTADNMLSTQIIQFLDTSSEWTQDQWLSFSSSTDRYLIVSEASVYNFDTLDWATNGVDMKPHYHTGQASDTLVVIPTLLNTRYVGVYDLFTASGFGISTNAETPINNYLVETWKETIGATTNYYLNISMNVIRWWHAGSGPIHAQLPTTFTLNLVKLDESVNPDIALKDSIRAIPDVIITTSAVDVAIPITIGMIILPEKAEIGDPVNVTVGIFGETIGKIEYRVDNIVTEHPWDVRYDFFIRDASVPHWGQRVSTIVSYPTIATHTITVVVYDTKSSTVPVATKTASIAIKARASDIYAWVAAIISILFGMFGIALVKNKKVGRAKGADCIDGTCTI
jgi:hypothetical protein